MLLLLLLLLLPMLLLLLLSTNRVIEQTHFWHKSQNIASRIVSYSIVYRMCVGCLCGLSIIYGNCVCDFQ